MDEWIKIRIDADLKRAAQDWCERNGVTLSDIIREHLKWVTRDA